MYLTCYRFDFRCLCISTDISWWPDSRAMSRAVQPSCGGRYSYMSFGTTILSLSEWELGDFLKSWSMYVGVTHARADHGSSYTIIHTL